MRNNLHMLQRCVTILNCDMMKISFKYLDMLVGGVTKDTSFGNEWWK